LRHRTIHVKDAGIYLSEIFISVIILDSYTFCFKRWYFRMGRMVQLAFENGSREIDVCAHSVIFVYPVSAPQVAVYYRNLRKKLSHVDK